MVSLSSRGLSESASSTAKQDRYKEITLEDVEVAISILEHFSQQMRKAEMVMNRMGGGKRSSGIGSSGNLQFNDIVRMSTEVQDRRAGKTGGQTGDIDIGEVSPEELKQMKDLVKKVRAEKG